jgi:dUTPase
MSVASKHSIHTGAGVIDADYRGPVMVLLFNLGEEDFNGKFSGQEHRKVVELTRR